MKIKEIKSIEDLVEFSKMLEEIKDFDLYTLCLVIKYELNKRGYKL